MVVSGSHMIIISTCFLLLFIFIPYAAPLAFNFTNISLHTNNEDIVLRGDAYIAPDGIQVTPNEIGSDRSQKAGRATYRKPLHLWDNASDELASFNTYFSFVIDSEGRDDGYYADGLTFFLAQNSSVITIGASMGLPINDTTLVRTDPFVAVEFDTFWNDWDPTDSTNSDHVGIDISNLTSVTSQKWFSNIPNGSKWEAWIKYDSVSKYLNVSLTGSQNNTVVGQVGLLYTVDLREVLPEWVIFGFSAATGANFEKNNVKSWTFNGSNLQIDNNNGLSPAMSPNEVENGLPPMMRPNPKKKKKRTGFVVGLIIGSCVLVASVLAFILWRKKKNSGDAAKELQLGVEMNNEFEMGTGAKKFSYRKLARSTANFAEKGKLGEGGFGGVYRGFLKDSNTYVAVKRVSKDSKQGIKEYASEVRIISRLRHKNLVKLMGWCHEKGELLLVYEYMENGSLDSHLFNTKSLLTWDKRFKIANGLASALLYLHEEWEQCVLHRDIKSSNLMLDSNFNTKLGDFGLAKLVDHDKGSKTTKLGGTLGYMAPEYIATRKASKQSDVFSFGVVTLEIACGRKPLEFEAEARQISLVEWVWELYGYGTLVEAVDPRLDSNFNKEEIERLMIVGLWCAHPDPNIRPSMRQVIQVLNLEASLPILPSKMPMATYNAPS